MNFDQEQALGYRPTTGRVKTCDGHLFGLHGNDLHLCAPTPRRLADHPDGQPFRHHID